jgi:hypothetical protein
MTQQSILGKGIPNLYLQKDYASQEGWCVRVETIVPVNNKKEIEDWLDAKARSKDLADSLIGQVPDGGDQFGARHMVAAALGFELSDDGKSVSKARVKPPSIEREVGTPSRT